MDGHSAFELHDERGDSKYGTITANEGAYLFVLSLIFAWYWLPLRLLCSHLLALEVARADAAALFASYSPRHGRASDGARADGARIIAKT